MPRQHNINGNKVPFTASEEAEWDIKEQEWNNNVFNRAIYTLRTKRNKLLADTDHYALSDQTLSAEMNTYRQQLRDLTNGLTTVEDVNNVVYPTKPSE